jgi:hypothetical protein
MSRLVRNWAFMFLAVAVGGFLGYYLQMTFLDMNAVCMANRLRVISMETVMLQVARNGLTWLDDQNMQGKLSVTINRQALLLHNLVSGVCKGQ